MLRIEIEDALKCAPRLIQSIRKAQRLCQLVVRFRHIWREFSSPLEMTDRLVMARLHTHSDAAVEVGVRHIWVSVSGAGKKSLSLSGFRQMLMIGAQRQYTSPKQEDSIRRIYGERAIKQIASLSEIALMVLYLGQQRKRVRIARPVVEDLLEN